jgi:hypothetical protein
MLGDVERDEAPTMVGEHDQDEEHAQARGGDGETSRETSSPTWLARNDGMGLGPVKASKACHRPTSRRWARG